MGSNGNRHAKTAHEDPVLVVVQLSGGNDFMNTVVPYSDPHYYDHRAVLGVPEDNLIPINEDLAFHGNAAPLKEFWDDGKLAIVQASATRIPAGRTSAACTSGIPASRRRYRPRAGSA